jgi:hypothetical protein
MLHEFLTENRHQIILRCRDKVARRYVPAGVPEAVDHGVPLFLQQLTDTLRHEQSTTLRGANDPHPAPADAEIGTTAALHGADLLRLGFSVEQVVREYGDVCQAVTELAVEAKELVTADEFRTLNRCLDNAIADAVTAHGLNRKAELSHQAELLYERLVSYSSEQRRLLDSSIQAFEAIQTGNIGLTGATGTMLKHSLLELRALSDWALSEIRLASATTTLPPP